jgi:hypothetical protein
MSWHNCPAVPKWKQRAGCVQNLHSKPLLKVPASGEVGELTRKKTLPNLRLLKLLMLRYLHVIDLRGKKCSGGIGLSGRYLSSLEFYGEVVVL